jgi:hypothetical protein
MTLFSRYDRYIESLAARQDQSDRRSLLLVLAPFLAAMFLVSGTFNALGRPGPIGFFLHIAILLALLIAMLYSGVRYLQHASSARQRRLEWAERLKSSELRELLRKEELTREQVADARQVLWSRGDE